MRTSYVKIYGAPLRQLSARLGVSYQTVRNWHARGQLREVLITRKRPERTSYFRRKYGYTLRELAARSGTSLYKTCLIYPRSKVRCQEES